MFDRIELCMCEWYDPRGSLHPSPSLQQAEYTQPCTLHLLMINVYVGVLYVIVVVYGRDWVLLSSPLLFSVG